MPATVIGVSSGSGSAAAPQARSVGDRVLSAGQVASLLAGDDDSDDGDGTKPLPAPLPVQTLVLRWALLKPPTVLASHSGTIDTLSVAEDEAVSPLTAPPLT